MIQRDVDAAIGAGMTAAGSTGIGVQWLLDFGSLTVMAINFVLGIGGLYLLYLRIRSAKGQQDGRLNSPDDI